MGSKVAVKDDNSQYNGCSGFVVSWRMVEVDFQDELACEVCVSLIEPDETVHFYDFQIVEISE